VVFAALGATLSFLSLPAMAQGAAEPATGTSSTSYADTTNSAMATNGQDFVPAQAILTDTLDAKKLQPGASFEAKLDGKVKLPNGTELPSGTMLHGTVATDSMNIQGNAKLALRITSAELKNGKNIPLHAAIVGFQAPGNQEVMAYSGDVSPRPNDWQPGTRAVDQIGVTSGVDLHSRLDGQNSGVFVTTTKDNVKLSKGSAMNLAIASAPAA